MQEREIQIATSTSMKACEECKKPGPNRHWIVLQVRREGVLCDDCLAKTIAEISAKLAKVDIRNFL